MANPLFTWFHVKNRCKYQQTRSTSKPVQIPADTLHMCIADNHLLSLSSLQFGLRHDNEVGSAQKRPCETRARFTLHGRNFGVSKPLVYITPLTQHAVTELEQDTRGVEGGGDQLGGRRVAPPKAFSARHAVDQGPKHPREPRELD